MQEKLQELLLWEKLELQQRMAERDATEKSKVQKAKDDLAARQAELKRGHHENSRYQSSYGTGKQSMPAQPDYRSQSNDRFKEMHNHRDSWIDSKGGTHIH